MMSPLAAGAFEQNTGALTGSGTITQTQPSGLGVAYTVTGSSLTGSNGAGLSDRGGIAGNFIGGLDRTTPTLQLSADHTSGCAHPAKDATNYCTNRGTVVVDFEHPTKNPVIHLAGLGGYASASNSSSGTRNYELLIYSGALKLTGSSPGGAATAVVTGTNLQVANGYVQASNPRTGAGCSETLTSTGSVSVSNGGTAACGSVQISGTYSQLTFQIDLQTTCLTSSSNQNDCSDVNAGTDVFLLSTTNGLDFGDAPAGYNASDAARHAPGSLALGTAAPDDDGGSRNPTASPVAVAAGGDANGANGDGADEDAFASLPNVVAQGTAPYAVTVPLSGTSKQGAVMGWIDFNRNGAFDTGENAGAKFLAGASSVTLSFSKPAGLTPGLTYARFRTAFDSTDVTSPNGAAASGEVEDYSLNIVNEVGALTLVKGAGAVQDTNNDGFNSAGDKVTYSFTVTNTGNTAVSSIAIADPKIAGVTCQATTLAANATTTCSGTYTLTQSDVNAGNVANTATVTGTTATGASVSKTASTNRNITQLTRASLTKSAGTLVDNDSNGPDIGDTIAYTFTVTNTGNLNLTVVTINDPKITDASCPAGTVAPGATKQCTGTYTLTQADVNAGKVDNTATATVTSSAGSATTSPATANRAFTPTTTFTFDKQAGALNDLDANGPDVGDTITYSFVFTNTGTAALNTPSVTDNRVGTVTCPTFLIESGASATCMRTYTLTQSDVESGAVNNTATGRMKAPNGTALPTSAPDQTSTTVTPSNAVKLTKSAGAPNLGANNRADQGDTIAYSFEIENTSGSTLTTPTVNDPKVGAVTCASGPLTPGQKVTCTKTYSLTQADVDAGTVNNTAAASAALPNSAIITSAASTTSTPLQRISSVSFDKVAGSIVDANATNKVDVGDTIQYSFTTTNTGNTTLTSIVVTDSKVGAVTCSPPTLAPSATLVCTKVYSLTQPDLDSGAVNNSATVSATPQGGTRFTSAPDETSTPINSTGTMTLSKVPGAINDLDANGPDVGDTISYTFTITNTGTATINGLSVTDSKIAGSTIACSPSSIAPNATSTCAATYALTQPDVDAGKVDNSATANGTKAGGGPISANRTATKTFVPTSSFEMDKQASAVATGADGRVDVGDSITYSFVFTNTGTTTLTNPTVGDVKTGPVSCPSATLAPGQSVTCTKVYALTQPDIDGGAVTNNATGTMNSPVGLPGPAPSGDSTSTPVAPLPSAVHDVSTGRQGQVQSVDPLANDTPGAPTVPLDAMTLTLLNSADSPTTSVVVEGGVYAVLNGQLAFTPEAGFVGTAAAARYRVTDTLARSVHATYAPTVTPVTPVAVNDTSSGQLNRAQSVDPLANDTAGDASVLLDSTSLALLDVNGRRTSRVAVAGGVYATVAERIVFTPTTGFVGTGMPVRYQVADVNGTFATATYTPTVADGAIVKDYAKTARRGASVAFNSVAGTPGLDGSTVRLIDPGSRAQVLQVAVSGQGGWTVDPNDGAITFVPAAGLTGDPTPFDYVGQTRDGTNVTGTLSIDYVGPGSPRSSGGGGGGGGGTGTGIGTGIGDGGGGAGISNGGGPGTGGGGLTSGTGSGAGSTGIRLLPGTGVGEALVPLGLLGLVLVGIGISTIRRKPRCHGRHRLELASSRADRARRPTIGAHAGP